MNARAVIWLAVLSVLWGSVYALTSVGLNELPALLVVVARSAFATAGLLPLAVSRRRLGSLITQPLGWVIVVAFVQSTIPLVLLTTGQQHIESSQAGVLLATQPIFSAILATAVDRNERYSAAGMAAFATGFMGVVLLLAPDLSGGTADLTGATLVLGASFCFGAGAVLLRHRLPNADPIGVATVNMVVSTVVLGPWALLNAPQQLPSTRGLVALAVLGIACTGWALALFYHLVHQAGAARAGLASYLAPGVAVILGTLLLGEALTLNEVAGLLLILVGSILAARPTSDQRQPSWRACRRAPADAHR